MNAHAVIVSQYLAALEMLKQAIERCPDTLWADAGDKAPFWQISYHALFFTHLYLQDRAEDFTPWSRHREHSEVMGGRLPWPPYTPIEPGEPYANADVLDYLAFCQAQVAEKTPALDLAAPSGFEWLPFDKLELQFYSIRHLQQHVGELMERLGSRTGVDVDWVSWVRA